MKFASVIRKLPLRVVLIAPFVAQIITTVVLVGYLSYKNGQAAINDLANQLMAETGDRIEENLTNYLTIPDTINQSNAAALKLGILDPNNLRQIQELFWEQIHIYPEVSGIMITNENNDCVIIERSQDKEIFLRIFNESTAGMLNNYILDSESNPIKMTASYPYDPQNAPPQDPWYIATQKAKDSLWRHTISAPKGHEQPIVILANFRAFYDQNNQFAGIIAVALYLDKMNKFLESLDIGKTGNAFIIDHQGFLINTSTGEKTFDETPQSNQAENVQVTNRRKKAIDSDNLLTQAVGNFLENKLTESTTLNPSQNLTINLNNQRYFLRIKPTQSERGLQWFIVIAIPEEDFMQEINEHNRTTIFLSILTLLIAIILGILTARWVTRPIVTLNEASKEIAQGNFSKHIPQDREDELGELTTSFNLMAKQLQESFENLDDKVKVKTKELIIAKEKAEVANQAKSNFIAKMSHELRTPLNAILGFSQIMIRAINLPKEHKESTTIINKSGNYLLTLINNILDLSKIEAGKITFNPKNFDLYALLDEVEDLLSISAQNKGLELIIQRTIDLPQYINTDETKLRQVLINLINNGIKFTSQGGVYLTVKYKQQIEQLDKATIYFSIRDTGVGIPSDELEQIFEAFTQTQVGRNSQEGTGLGLTISRRFIQLMGGDIKVDSQVGIGATFDFNIQVDLVSDQDLAEETFSPQVIGLQPHQPTYKILIVDDRAVNRLLLIKLLEPLGFAVKEAANGQEAIAIWDDWDPHLIWMDMRMPIMDGYDATQKIKSTTKGNATAVIALTASVLEEEKAIVLSAGCDDFVRKPFQESVIFEVLHKHLGVKYIYAQENTSESASQSRLLTVEDLAIMSQEWLNRLYQASKLLDEETIRELSQEIPTEYNFLAIKINDLVNDFQFHKIRQLIEKINNE